MGSISIKKNGAMRNFDLSYLDWTKAQAANTANVGITDLGDLIYTRENCLCEGTLIAENIPEGATNKFYIFKSNNFPNSLIQGYTLKDEQRGGRVLYFGAFQEPGDNINDFFPEAPEDDRPPSNYTVDVTNPEQFKWWSKLGSGYSYYGPVYKTGNTVPDIFLNYNALGYFETSAGCTFGASMDMLGGNVFGVTAGIQIHSYGAYKYLNSNSDRFPTLTGNQAFGGKPWGPQYDGQQIIPYPSNEVAYNAYTRSLRDWSIMADDVAIADIGDDITAEFVATSINNILYAGLAACRWTGNHISEIQVTLLPAWFWGRESMELDWDFDTPDIDDAWYGPNVPSKPGADGTYQYTQQPAGDISLPATSVYDFYTQGVGGTHVYMLNGTCISKLVDEFWRYVNQDNAKEWINQGIVTIHQMPHGLLPANNPNNNVSKISIAGMSISVPTGGLAQIVNPYTSNSLGTFLGGKGDPLCMVNDCYLDFEPYTQVQLFLPFAGTIEIPSSQCIGGSIKVTVNCDNITGDIVYEIKCTSGPYITDHNGERLINHYYVTGNCAVEIPIAGITNGTRQSLSGISQMAGGIGQVLGGSVAAFHGLGTAAAARAAAMSSVLNAGGTAAAAAAAGATAVPLGTLAAIGIGAYAATGGFANFGEGLQDYRDPIKHVFSSGGISGAVSAIGQKSVILRITRPKKAYEKNWLVLGGIRSELDANLSTFVTDYSTTYTKVRFVNVNTISSATVQEKGEIEKLLMGGVYL